MDKNNKTRESLTGNLREQAEKRLRKIDLEFVQDLSPEAFKNLVVDLVRELQVHQIELEMQNEDLRRTCQEAEEARNRYNDLYDFAPVGYFTLNSNGKILDVNRTGAVMLGVKKAYLLDRLFDLHLEKSSRSTFWSFCKRVLKTDIRQTCEVELLKKELPSVYILIEGVAAQDVERGGKVIRAAVVDVTARKKAEEALKDACNELERRVEERTSELEAANRKLSQEVAEHKLTLEAMARDREVDSALATLSKALLLETSTDTIAHLVLDSGQCLTGSAFGFVGHIDPETGYLVSPTLTRDIWDACQVEDKRTIFKKFTGLWGWVLDNRQALMTNNPGEDPRSSGTPSGHVPIERFLGVPAKVGEQIFGMVGLANADRDFTERDLQVVKRLADLYSIALRRSRVEEELDKYRDHLEDLVRVRTEELGRTHEELHRAKKLEAIGVLAGGMAHDFNNLLSVVIGNINLAQMGIEHGEEVSKPLRSALEAALSAGGLTKQFITFSTGGAPVKKLISIRGLIKVSVDMALSGSNLKCDYSFPEDPCFVEVDEGLIAQALHNVVTNAREAILEGGTIGIGVERIEGSAAARKAGLPEAGPHVRISVRDSGKGIPRENLDKIFDPYFSTKERGMQKGMGLGLTVAYSIVKNHGGYIAAESKEGAGTVFHICLPLSTEVISEEEPEPPVESTVVVDQAAVAGIRVLLMEDEEIFRIMAGQMLYRLGCEKVSLVTDGREAIREFRAAGESGKPFHVVILDLTVKGGMGGKEAIRALLEIDPSVKAIVSSGYSHDPVMSDFGAYGFRAALAKPYQMSELSRTLKMVLPRQA